MEVIESSWNVMARGDARERKWRGNWRMEWVASTLHTTSATWCIQHYYRWWRTPRLPVVDWTDATRRFKWTRPFRRETKSGFCACAITFQTQSTALTVMQIWSFMYFSNLMCLHAAKLHFHIASGSNVYSVYILVPCGYIYIYIYIYLCVCLYSF